MGEVDQLTQDMERISEIKRELEQVGPLKDELDELKGRVLQHMQSSMSKRTEAVGGYFIVRSEVPSVSITDPAQVEGWLEDNDFIVEDFKKLDTTMVKSVVEGALESTGEVVPGVNRIIQEVASLRKAKVGGSENK